MHRQIEPTHVTRLGGFALVKEVPLPLNIEGRLAVEDMVIAACKSPVVRGDLQIGEPQVANRFNCNTRIVVTWPNKVGVVGEATLYYNRVGLGELKIPSGFLPQDETSVWQLIPRLKTALEIDFVETDFLNNLVGDETVLVAADTSYFFIPGSRVILGGAGS